MDKYLLAFDLGTSGNKATLFSVTGEMIGSTVAPYETRYFNGSWVEQNADDWWNSVCKSTRLLLEKTGIDPHSIAGISFSGQMMGCLCVDKQGRPLRPAIIWADQRSKKEEKLIASRIDPFEYYSINGHRINCLYGLFKFMWVQKHEPEIYEKTYKTLNAKDYIVMKMTGTFCTDRSDANSCGFFDLEQLDWSEKLLSLTSLDRKKLPEVKPSTFCAGGVTTEAAKATGLAEGTPVIIGSGDGVSASVGVGSVVPGKAYCCLGTSAWIADASSKPLIDPQMRTVTWPHMVSGLYVPNGTMQYACGSYSWLKNTICKIETQKAAETGVSPYELMNELAEKSSPGANELIFLPYLVGERAPRWDADAKGCFIGLSAETSRGDIIRSVLEGITYNLAIILDILQPEFKTGEITVLGGGAKGELWQQIMADVFGVRILVPELLEEAGAMGAAVCAGVGAGIYEDFSAVERFIKIKEVRYPDSSNEEAYRKCRDDFERYYMALRNSWK